MATLKRSENRKRTSAPDFPLIDTTLEGSFFSWRPKEIFRRGEKDRIENSTRVKCVYTRLWQVILLIHACKNILAKIR